MKWIKLKIREGYLMKKGKLKAYIYTRVSTAMQTEGYSLDAQKSRIYNYAKACDIEIVGEYEDAGISGKSIEGRIEFKRMIQDIRENKDDVNYVMVFKLSRFGRNAADVLNTLQLMQDYGVNLISVEDGIDSSKEAGKLMISVLSAVAEIERENIRVQTMEGRKQKAREGRWNGGFAPYGYKLIDGKLEIEENEAQAIRLIFNQYINTDMGATGVSKYLVNHGITKIPRKNGTNPFFEAALIRKIIKNPVYCGKISYGRRQTEKVKGTRNKYHLVEQDNYILADGIHEGIISEEMWKAAQRKIKAQAKKYEKTNVGSQRVHLLSGIVKCPVCGQSMYSNKSIKKKSDGSSYKDYYFYACKNRNATRGHKCNFKNNINEEQLDASVVKVISSITNSQQFKELIQDKIDTKIDVSELTKEKDELEKQYHQATRLSKKIIEQMDLIDINSKHYDRQYNDYESRLNKQYDRIEELEIEIDNTNVKIESVKATAVSKENIYKVLENFEKLFKVMNESERRQFIEKLVDEIHIHSERPENGQWIKSVHFKLPIVKEKVMISLDKNTHVETVVLLRRII